MEERKRPAGVDFRLQPIQSSSIDRCCRVKKTNQSHTGAELFKERTAGDSMIVEKKISVRGMVIDIYAYKLR